MAQSLFLGIETSCDESAAAVLSGGVVLSSLISSQTEIHAPFGGVVPELAARRHEQTLMPIVEDAMATAGVQYRNLHAIAVTRGPGLVGALVVGVAAARALGLVANCPVYGVNHLEAHVLSSFLEHEDLMPPTVCLLVSGGHTMIVHVRDIGDYVVLGETVDDAVGEAYDKVARYLGLGFPGGPPVDRLSAKGDPTALQLPRPMIHDGLHMSFSGLKTATVRAVAARPDVTNEDVSASFVAATIDVLRAKVRAAVRATQVPSLCIGGGVAASGPLRDAMQALAQEEGIACFLPPRSMCTDNAAMIAHAAYRLAAVGLADENVEVEPGLPLVRKG